MYGSIIGAQELADLLGQKNRTIIDCRSDLNDFDAGQMAYNESHIPGAFFAHLEKDLSGEIINGETGRHPFPIIGQFEKKCRLWGINKNTQVIAYDHGHGGIAARLWYLLKYLGHNKVAVLNGGWNHWLKLGLPISQDIPAPSSGTFHANEQKDWLVPATKLEKIISDGHFTVFDSRTADRYRGENETIDPVAGHIPGAVSAPFLDNIGPDGLFLGKKELVARFEKLLAEQPIEQAVFYCGSGVTACHNLLALSYIGKDGAKLYPGSWSEWITDPKRPIVKGA